MNKKIIYMTSAGWITAVSSFYGIIAGIIALVLSIGVVFAVEYGFLKTRDVRAAMWGIAGAFVSAVAFGLSYLA